MMVDNVYILDNGAYTAKVELSKASAPRIVPNCIMKAKSERRRPFIGDQVEECRDASGLFYLLPFQKGFLVNWDVQKTVWDYMFSKECCYGNFTETPLIVTEPCFNFPSIQEAMSEIFFEEYECQSLLRINANCVVKEEFQRVMEILQFQQQALADNPAIFGSASYILKSLSHNFTRDEDLKTILWEQNHNPLLHHSLNSDSFTTVNKSSKPLWIRRICNFEDEQLFLELDLIHTLHSYLHAKHKKQKFLLELHEFCYSDYLVEEHDNCKSGTCRQTAQHAESNNVIPKCPLSQHDISNNTVERHNTKTLIDRFSVEDYCDSNDQPVNYSLKYFEHETPPMLDNMEQPVNFSLKYLEEMEIESSMAAELMMFGAGEICYAETDLDQTPDDIFSFLDRVDANHCDEESDIHHHKNYPLSFSEELKNYQVEGTPCDFSMATSLSGICTPASIEEVKVGTGKVPPPLSPTFEVVSCPDSIQSEVVIEKSEVMMLETPLMFSRCSSVSSLTSVEPLDDVTSVISEYSRIASGMISPSDLPDSPTQTSAPIMHSFKRHTPLKPSVFEEKVLVFREESTPAQFSTTSSLSALSFDENQLIERPSDFKLHNQSVQTSETASIDGKDDEDILAACISAGMQIGKGRSSDNMKSGKHCERLRKTNEFSSCIRRLDKDVSRMPLESNSASKHEVLDNDTKTFTTEGTPSSISHSTSRSELSKLLEDSDHTDILAECIQAGMPKARGRSKCNVKKSVKMSLKHSSPKDIPSQNCETQKPAGSLVRLKPFNDALSNVKPLSTGKAYHSRNVVTTDSRSAGHVVVAQETGKSPFISPYEPNINEAKVQLSRRSSIESGKEDSTEDPVTLSELLLLEQCITSGMPKKKTR